LVGFLDKVFNETIVVNSTFISFSFDLIRQDVILFFFWLF
jgi:hypothetical protein